MKKIEKLIEKGTDEEVLEALTLFLGRVNIATQFIQDEDGIISHEIIIFKSGDKILMSDPRQLDWLMQPLPLPEEWKSRAH